MTSRYAKTPCHVIFSPDNKFTAIPSIVCRCPKIKLIITIYHLFVKSQRVFSIARLHACKHNRFFRAVRSGGDGEGRRASLGLACAPIKQKTSLYFYFLCCRRAPVLAPYVFLTSICSVSPCHFLCYILCGESWATSPKLYPFYGLSCTICQSSSFCTLGRTRGDGVSTYLQ